MVSLLNLYNQYQEIESAFYKAKRQTKKELLKKLEELKKQIRRYQNPEWLLKQLFKSRGNKNGRKRKDGIV